MSPRRVTLVTSGGLENRQVLNLSAGQVHVVRYELPQVTDRLTAWIESDDALAIDNRVVLLAPAPTPVRIGVDMENAPLEILVRQAINAAGQAELVNGGADLIVTDRPDRPLAPTTWPLLITSQIGSHSYRGPFFWTGAARVRRRGP